MGSLATSDSLLCLLSSSHVRSQYLSQIWPSSLYLWHKGRAAAGSATIREHPDGLQKQQLQERLHPMGKAAAGFASIKDMQMTLVSC